MGTKNYNNALDLVSFSRASGGTALRKISYGSELVTNGTFDTDTTGWTALSSATLSVASQKLRVTNVGANFGKAEQAITTVVGKVYEWVFEYSGGTSTQYNYRAGTTSAGIDVVANTPAVSGTNTVYFVAQSTTTYLSFVNDGTDTNYSDWDNISVKEVLFDQPDGTLTLFNHPDDIPRIDYDASGNPKGILIEEARTNLVVQSNDFSTQNAVRSTITDNSSTSPDGTVSAARFEDTATSGDHRLDFTTFTVTSGNTYTYSIFAKAAELDWFRMWFSSDFGTQYANFNLSTGSIGVTTGIISANIEQASNGFYRCSIVGTATSTGSNNQRLQLGIGDNMISFTGDGASGIYIYGAQFEEGAFPTSYIGTSGASATRSADIASIDVDQFGYNQKAGAVVVEVRAEDTDSSVGDVFFQLYDGTSQNSIRFDRYTGNFAIRVEDDSVTQVEVPFPGTEPDTTTTYTVAAAYKLNDFAFIRSGSTLGTDTSGTVPDGITDVRISSGDFNGHIKSIKYYPRRLSNAQLQELTS